jgi:phage/plasmid-associated DNA primase
VLAWLVEGARRWHRDGLREVEAVRSATEDYRHSEDTFGAWVEDCTVAVDGVRTKVGDLWESWRRWCEGSNERPGRKQDFSRALADHGMEVETRQGYRLTRGIGLVVRSGEDSPRTSSISPSVGTLGVRPNETSHLDENGALQLQRLTEEFPGTTVEDALSHTQESGR